MKQRVVVAMLAVCALLMTQGFAHAQSGVYIKTSPPQWVNIQRSCPAIYSASASFTIAERLKDDIYGSQGQNHTFFDLMIALPPGFEFENNNTTNWSTANSADINNKLTQSYSGGITYRWSNVRADVLECAATVPPSGVTLSAAETPPDLYGSQAPLNADGMPAVNTLVMAGLEIKNTIKLDEIVITGVRIRMLPGATALPTAIRLWAWTYNETDHPSGRFVINGMPTLGTMTMGTVISYDPGILPASRLRFKVEPGQGPYDVQQKIPGVGSEPAPVIELTDCYGYAVVSDNLTVATVDVSLPTAEYWTGTGPTYETAFPTLPVINAGKKSVSLPKVPSGAGFTYQAPIDFSVAYEVSDASLVANNVTAVVNNVTTSLSIQPKTSLAFDVALRPISWSPNPVYGDPVYWYTNGANEAIYNVPVEGNPGIGIVNSPLALVAPNLAFGVLPSTQPSAPSLDSYSPIMPGSFKSYKELGDVGANPMSLSITSIPDSEMPSSMLMNKAYNYYAYALAFTYYYELDNGSPRLTSSRYLDPRYDYAVTSVNAEALPVELTAFTGQVRNEVVTLRWTTATETNNYGFEVERSFDRTDWSKVGFVAGGGTTSSQRDYSFQNALSKTDLMNGTISYRLRQIDRDGSIEYSPVVTVSVAPTASSMTLLQNFPNPFNPSTNISFNLPESGTVTLTVYSELGIEVARIHDAAQLEAGWHTASFNASALPSGLYSYRLSTPAGSVAKTMIVAK